MKSNKKWLKRLVTIFGVLYIVYVLAGFFVVPVVVEKNMEGKVSEILERRVEVEDVDFNPFTLALSIEGLFVADDQDGPLFSAGLIRTNVQLLSSAFTQSGRVKEFVLSDAVVTVRVLENGDRNFQRLLELAPAETEADPEQEKSEPVGFYVGKIDVGNFSVDFEDRSLATPMADVLGPISFVTEKLQSELNSESPYSFMARLGETAEIAWDGSIALAPLHSDGKFKITGLDLSKGVPYIREMIDIDLAGLLGVEGVYELAYEEGEIGLFANDVNVRLDGLLVSDLAEAESSIGFESIEVSGVALDSLKQTVSVKSVVVTNNVISGVRGEAGEVVVPKGKLLEPNDVEASVEAVVVDEPATDAAGAWKITLADFAYENGSVSVLDRSLETDAKTTISSIIVAGKNIDLTDEAAESVFDVSMLLNDSGKFEVSTAGNIPTQTFSGTFALSALELNSFQNYIAEYTHGELESGVFAFDGEFDYAPSKKPTASVNVALSAIKLNDLRSSETVASLGDLKISEIKYNGESASIAKVAVDSPAVSARSEELGINLATLVKGYENVEAEADGAEAEDVAAVEEEPVADEEAAVQEEMFLVTVGEVEVTNGDFRYTDVTMDPAFKVKMDQFVMTTSNLSTASEVEASPYSVEGRLDNTSSIKVEGLLNIANFHEKTTANVNLDRFDITGTLPFWRTYLGRNIDQGTLTIKSDYDIQKGILDSKNSITIDQLKLGDKVESEDSLGLPIGFAIALLQDASGVIQLNPPVKGDLSDPSVGGIASIVFKVMGNLIIKAVASPFSLFGGGGGGKDDLDTALVEPGSYSLSSKTLGSLDAISKILEDRPALKLGVVSFVDEKAELEVAEQAILQAYAEQLIETPSTSLEQIYNEQIDILESLKSFDSSAQKKTLSDAFDVVDWKQLDGFDDLFESLEPVGAEGSEMENESSEEKSVPTTEVEETEKKGWFKRVRSFVWLGPKKDGSKDATPEKPKKASKTESETIMADGEVERMLRADLKYEDKQDAIRRLLAYEFQEGALDALQAYRVNEARVYLVENKAIDPTRIITDKPEPEVEEATGLDASEEVTEGAEEIVEEPVSKLKFVLQ